MKHGSLFSGIGGFDLAASWMNWENVFHCEWNEFGQKILKQHFPKSISYGDITKTDFTIHRGAIDILTGGFPCQPYSTAGKRKGKEDERHLWPEMLRAIREIQPSYIVGENVRGLTNWNGGVVFDEVQADLEAECYEVLPFLLPACAVGAPHRRERIWFVAYSDKCAKGPSRTSGRLVGKRSNNNDEQEEWREQTEQHIGHGDVFTINTNANDRGLQGSENERGIKTSWENRNKQPTGFFQSEWKEFPTQSPICGRDDGFSNRVDRIKALGNAIVPQVALEIFKAIQSFENLKNFKGAVAKKVNNK